MKNKKVIPIITIVLLLMPALSGCLDIFTNGSTIYEPHATKIRYDIKYGYRINCTGTGNYEIRYRCDIPEVLLGTRTYGLLYNHDYDHIPHVNNSFISWNISGNENKDYELGITASIEVESFLVSDLSGKNALTILEINFIFPNIVEKYCQEQSNETTILINPNDPDIKETANDIFDQTNSNNSFVLAKSLFIWLKKNTEYKVHNDEGSVQPANLTYQKKTGDCDDLSFLYISLCRAVGIPARFVRGYLLTDEGDGEISSTAHAWTEVFVGGSIGDDGWIPVECACCTPSIQADVNQNFGVENAFHLRLFVDDGSNQSIITSLSGISYEFGQFRRINVQSFTGIENFTEIESNTLVVTKDNVRSYQ